MSTPNRDRSGRSGGGSVVPLGVTKLTELGGNIPNGKSRMCVENGINVPTLTSCNGHKWLITSLSPSAYVFSSFLKPHSEFIGNLLVETV